MLKFYNVLNKKKEEFSPIDENLVKMYACGITASGDAHIGHAYQAIVFDVIRKYLEYKGYNVKYVRNYTDVDDKIIIRAREAGISPTEFANEKMAKIDKELDALNIARPTIMSKATECIPDIISLIEKLIEKGHAYATEYGDVFFKVDSFPGYGKLSNRIIDDSISGVRKDVEPGKLDDRDFALWKKANDDEIYWESPWGLGRPGWHIECSAMVMKYLGDTIDIHGGGKDLIFPHHENEIAQSEALTGCQFSNYWIHNGLIKINGQKMSKSLNNGILLEDLLKCYNPEVIRMTLLENNYRSDMNVVDGAFEDHENKLYTIYKLFKQIDDMTDGLSVNSDSQEYKSVKEEFESAMDNDFNTSLAIANIYDKLNVLNKLINKKELQKLVDMKQAIVDCFKVLELFGQNPNEFVEEIKNKYVKKYKIDENIVLELISKRNEYKANKDYVNADMIRDELLNMNVVIKDSSLGTEWDVVIK